MTPWTLWIRRAWSALEKGHKVSAPSQLPHPSVAGFRPLAFAQLSGQCRDWTLPLDDGSRIHIHEFEDARLLVHRDRFDPDQNLASLARHLFFETWFGLAVMGLGVVLAARELSRV